MIGIGDEAPDFTLRDQNNEEVTLSSFRGKKAVLVIFYPLAFTGICTGELYAVRDDLQRRYRTQRMEIDREQSPEGEGGRAGR